MRRLFLSVPLLLLFNPVASGQNCSKVVAFAIADAGGVHPSLGTGNWIEKWAQKNGKKHSDICFSQSPLQGRANYLVVLSQSAVYLTGFDPVVRTDTSTTTAPVSGSGTVTDNYGGTWHYTYNGTVTSTTTTTTNEDVPYTINSRTIYAYAYAANGAIVSSHYHVYSTKSGGDTYNTAGYNIGSALAAINARGRLLAAVVKDVEVQKVSAEPPIAAARGTAPQSAQSTSTAPQAMEYTPTASAPEAPSVELPCKAYSNTGEKQFITENAHGKILILSDGSIWEVEEVDTVDSGLWLATEDVIVMRAEKPLACFDYTIINTEENAEKVQAKYLGQK